MWSLGTSVWPFYWSPHHQQLTNHSSFSCVLWCVYGNLLFWTYLCLNRSSLWTTHILLTSAPWVLDNVHQGKSWGHGTHICHLLLVSCADCATFLPPKPLLYRPSMFLVFCLCFVVLFCFMRKRVSSLHSPHWPQTHNLGLSEYLDYRRVHTPIPPLCKYSSTYCHLTSQAFRWIIH